MSCGEHHDTPCVDVLSSVIFFIDGEINDANQVHAFEVHISECAPCAAELEHERQMHSLLQSTLRRSCDEKAPEDLHRALADQLQSLSMGQGRTIRSEFRHTEISIEVNEFGEIEQHEITIEHTQEIRFPDELS